MDFDRLDKIVADVKAGAFVGGEVQPLALIIEQSHLMGDALTSAHAQACAIGSQASGIAGWPRLSVISRSSRV